MQIVEGIVAARAALTGANARRAFEGHEAQEDKVRAICRAVRSGGEQAVLQFTREFDYPDFQIEDLRVKSSEIDDAWAALDPAACRALERMAGNIEAFHRQQPQGQWSATGADGLTLGQRYTAIERVGMYAPNFRAAYPSTVLMLAIPARVAGVRDLVLASPPSRDGSSHPVILAAAKIAGITEIYRLGGAVAMAALAYGTSSIRPVDKLVGPGSTWVTLAKKQLYGTVGIDGLYGPSEVVVLAEGGNDAEQLAPQLAADLIAQAEHGADSFVCLIATSRALIDATLREVDRQTSVSLRAGILNESLSASLAFCVATMDEALELCNLAAAEHVEVWSPEARSLLPRIHQAGAVFLNTPVPLGDYIAGPCHTLPTGGSARFAHGVGVDTFLKRTSVIEAPPQAIAALEDDLATIALLEGLPGHAAAVHRAAQRPASGDGQT